MKNKVITFLFIIISTGLLAQDRLFKAGSYDIDINSEQVDCTLEFNSDSTYEVLLSIQETEDQVYCAILSYGHYSCSKKQLILHDDYYGFDWYLSFEDGDVVKVDRGYSFLNEVKIVDYQSYVNDIHKGFDSNFRSQLRNIEKNRKEKPIRLGKYNDPQEHYSLTIGNYGIYQLFLKDIILSEGLWKQKDNILILHDAHVNFVFAMILKDGTLYSISIPGEFGGTRLSFAE